LENPKTDHLHHGASKEPINPLWESIFFDSPDAP